MLDGVVSRAKEKRDDLAADGKSEYVIRLRGTGQLAPAFFAFREAATSTKAKV